MLAINLQCILRDIFGIIKYIYSVSASPREVELALSVYCNVNYTLSYKANLINLLHMLHIAARCIYICMSE